MLLDIAQRMEGGFMLSATARELMRDCHDVTIGEYSYGPCFDPAVAQGGITIGRYTSIASGVRFYTEGHPLDAFSLHSFFYESDREAVLRPGQLTIGSDVWIGANAIITPGCQKIGDGAVIGAGSIVTHDVDPYAIVAGNPARVIRDRFELDRRNELLLSKWWDLRPEEVESLLGTTASTLENGVHLATAGSGASRS